MENTSQLHVFPPIQNHCAEFSYLKKADSAAATRYYKQIFLGKDMAFVNEFYKNERKVMKSSKGDIKDIVLATKNLSSKNIVYLTFFIPFRNPDSGKCELSYSWSIDLKFNEKGIIVKVDVEGFFEA